jgi:hypothetical protein
MAVISMRNTTYSLQTSVYIVYLDRIALVGTTIGTLFAAAEITSGLGTLSCIGFPCFLASSIEDARFVLLQMGGGIIMLPCRRQSA